MSNCQPLEAFSPPSANALNTGYAHVTRSTQRANGTATMEEEDLQDEVSVVSDLGSADADDDFERIMIQNARDERRLSQALGGRPQAFRKARTHPRVGLTMDNLERNNAAAGSSAQAKPDSPPSDGGSTRSDPSIHAPAGWGRKSRRNKNWMRTITYEEQQPQQTPAPADDTLNDHYDNPNANIPRRSVEDSPLSHKSIHGTPRNDPSEEWDLTFELNEASMIASTPYIPRNTALDDIRQREMESLREQAVATARPESIRAGSPEHTRRRTASIRTTNSVATTGARTNQQSTQGSASPQKRLRTTRTQSWQPMGKAQSVTGIGKEDAPVAMYKSAENIATVDRDVVATAHKDPPKRIPHRREDSQDLLRRLARLSNTPSPAQVSVSRPQTAPTSLHSVTADAESTPQEKKEEPKEPVEEEPAPDSVPESAETVPVKQEEAKETPQDAEPPSEPEPAPSPETRTVDATPMPVERTILNPKTPVVTGAWVDTPGPRTAARPTSKERSPSPPLEKSNPRRDKSPERRTTHVDEETAPTTAIEVIRPQLPRSALQALVEEAKSHPRRPSADYGDSTINSLEELITSLPDTPQADEDTLQGLQLPTAEPRNEGERQRQQELVHLYRMNDRLRAARCSIRDASRGMKRVEDQVEHVEEMGENGTKIVYKTCVCSSTSHQNFSMWKWWKSLFWQERLKTLRCTENSAWRVWGGLTGLGIFALMFCMWWVGEEVACELFCHPTYATSSPYPFAVNMNAPKYPFVLPTLVYRGLIRDWWAPLWTFFSWIAAMLWKGIGGFGESKHLGTHTGNHGQSQPSWHVGGEREAADVVVEESIWDASMLDDEVLRAKV